METSLTVADVKQELAYMALTPAEIVTKLNRVSRRVLESDSLANYYSMIGFDGSTGLITVPRRFSRIYGITKDMSPMAVVSEYSQWHEYGWGYQDPTKMSLRGIVDLGFKFPLACPMPSAGVMRVKITSAEDVGKTVYFTGPDEQGQQVFTNGAIGFPLVTASPSVTGDVLLSDVEGLFVPGDQFVARWTLWVVTDGVETQIGSYEPGESHPRYHRYKLAQTTSELLAFCKRIHVPLVADTDWVFPDNITTIEFGFQALDYERNGNYSAAGEAWQQAYSALAQQYAGARTPLVTMLASEPPVRRPWAGQVYTEGSDYGREHM